MFSISQTNKPTASRRTELVGSKISHKNVLFIVNFTTGLMFCDHQPGSLHTQPIGFFPLSVGSLLKINSVTNNSL